MNRIDTMPWGVLRGPHIQRLVERWWRRWGYALTACALAALVMYWRDPEVGQSHAQAEQAVARLQQQLAASPLATPAPPDPAQARNTQRWLDSLPAQARQGHIWTDWQQVLAAHGLRLLSVRPMPSASAAVPAPTPAPTPAPASAQAGRAHQGSHGTEPGSSWPHQVAAMRVQGRFEDWAQLWAACARTGPVCSIDRIAVTALPQTAEVQIDVVLRIWMRPAADAPLGPETKGDAAADAQAGSANWTNPLLAVPASRAQVALFAADTADTVAAPSVAGAAREEELLPDPRHWPLARLRLMGLWQQGNDRQAILAAGTHWAKVGLGQRVTQEGHRVVAITGQGVRLRLGPGPLIALDWPGPVADSHSTGGTPP